MNAITLPGSQLTMTSKEIADLTGKRHDNVMRDIRAMLGELYGEGGVLSFEGTHRSEQNGQEYPVFVLPKRESLILVSGYSTEMRAKIIDRWQALEARAPALPNLRDPAQMSALAVQLLEFNQELQAELAAAAPKIAFAEAVGDAENLQKPKEVANAMGMGLVKFYAALRQRAFLQRDNRPYQRHIDANRCRMIEVPYTNKQTGERRIKLELRFTGRGVTYIQQLLANPLP